MSDETGDGSDAQLGELGGMAAWIDDVVLRSVSGDRVVGRRRCQPGAVVRFDRIGPEGRPQSR